MGAERAPGECLQPAHQGQDARVLRVARLHGERDHHPLGLRVMPGRPTDQRNEAVERAAALQFVEQEREEPRVTLAPAVEEHHESVGLLRTPETVLERQDAPHLGGLARQE